MTANAKWKVMIDKIKRAQQETKKQQENIFSEVNVTNFCLLCHTHYTSIRMCTKVYRGDLQVESIGRRVVVVEEIRGRIGARSDGIFIQANNQYSKCSQHGLSTHVIQIPTKLTISTYQISYSICGITSSPLSFRGSLTNISRIKYN